MFRSPRPAIAAMSVGLALACVAVDAQAKEYKLARQLNQVTAGETLLVAVDSIEPGKSEYLVRLVLQNVAKDRTLVMQYEALQCWRGENQSNLKHAAFGIGERAIDLQPGEVKDFPLICEHGSVAGGEFKINVLHVADGNGQILLDDVTWTLSEAALDKKAQTVPAGFVPKVTDHKKPASPTAPPPPPTAIIDEAAEAVGKVVGEIKEAVEDDPAPAPAPAPK